MEYALGVALGFICWGVGFSMGVNFAQKLVRHAFNSGVIAGLQVAKDIGDKFIAERTRNEA